MAGSWRIAWLYPCSDLCTGAHLTVRIPVTCRIHHPVHSVSALVLRAVCLMRKIELDWVFSPVGAAAKIPKVSDAPFHVLPPSQEGRTRAGSDS